MRTDVSDVINSGLKANNKEGRIPNVSSPAYKHIPQAAATRKISIEKFTQLHTTAAVDECVT